MKTSVKKKANKSSSSNRSFGIVFFIVFFIIAFWNFRGEIDQIRILPFIVSLVFLILGLINSKLLGPLNLIWIKFGEILGKFISPLIMGAIYFVIVTPIGVFMRFIGKDLLKIKFSKSNSYWIERQKNIGPMKRQF